jgi:hypothetical protein
MFYSFKRIYFFLFFIEMGDQQRGNYILMENNRAAGTIIGYRGNTGEARQNSRIVMRNNEAGEGVFEFFDNDDITENLGQRRCVVPFSFMAGLIIGALAGYTLRMQLTHPH